MTAKLKKQKLPPYFMSIVIAVLILGVIIGVSSSKSSSNVLYPVAIIILSPVLLGISFAFIVFSYVWCKLGVFIWQAIRLRRTSRRMSSLLPGLLAAPYIIAAMLSILSLGAFVGMTSNGDSWGLLVFYFFLWQFLVLLSYLSARRAHVFYQFLKSLSWMVSE